MGVKVVIGKISEGHYLAGVGDSVQIPCTHWKVIGSKLFLWGPTGSEPVMVDYSGIEYI